MSVDVEKEPLDILKSVPFRGHGENMSAVHDYVFAARFKGRDVVPELEAAFKRAILDATGNDYEAVHSAQEYVHNEVGQGRYIELLQELGRI